MTIRTCAECRDLVADWQDHTPELCLAIRAIRVPPVRLTGEGEDPFTVQEKWTDEERTRLYNAEMGVMTDERDA